MRLRSKLNWFVAFALLGYAASPAGAAPGVTGFADVAPGQVGFQGKVVMTPEAMDARVSRHLDLVSAAVTDVQAKLAEARKQKDVVKTLCLNDVLNQLDTAKKSIQQHRTNFQAAHGRSDTELMGHEYTMTDTLGDRVAQLKTDANRCIGQEAAYNGATITFTTVDPNLPPDQTGLPPFGPVNIPSPPVEVLPPPATSPAR